MARAALGLLEPLPVVGDPVQGKVRGLLLLGRQLLGRGDGLLVASEEGLERLDVAVPVVRGRGRAVVDNAAKVGGAGGRELGAQVGALPGLLGALVFQALEAGGNLVEFFAELFDRALVGTVFAAVDHRGRGWGWWFVGGSLGVDGLWVGDTDGAVLIHKGDEVMGNEKSRTQVRSGLDGAGCMQGVVVREGCEVIQSSAIPVNDQAADAGINNRSTSLP